MITQLTQDYDRAIEGCFHHCGPGINYNVIHRAFKHMICNMINDCCDLINQNKQAQVKAEFISDFVDIAGLCVYAVFSVFDPIEKFKRMYKVNQQGQVLVKIKLPSYSQSFNEEPQEWYIEAMRILWEGYKDYMKENYNHI